MKLKMNIYNAIIINAKSEEYEKKDKTKGVMYKVSFDCDGECGTMNATEDVVKVLDGYKYKPADMVAEYNDQYGSIRIVSAQQRKA